MRFASSQQADFGGCEVVVEERIVNQRLTAAPIEGRSGAAFWTDDGRLVHYSACQGAHPTKALLAEIYGLPAAQVRVIVPDVGGGFGAKARTYPEELALGRLRPAGRTARALDGDAHREHPRHAQRARPGAARQARREPRRPDHRLPARCRPGRRRLPARRRRAAGDDAAHGNRRVRHRQRRLHRRLRRHQHGVDDGVPRRRPSGGGRGDRADGRSLRRRDRDGSGRRSPEELRRPLHGAVHDGDRHGVRRRRLPGVAGAGAGGGPLRRAARRAGASPGRRRSDRARDRAGDLRRGHRRAAGHGVRRGRARRRRWPAGPQRGDAVRAGPCDDVGDDRRRRHRRADRPDRGRPRRHRCRSLRRADRRVALGATRRCRPRRGDRRARRRRPGAGGGPLRGARRRRRAGGRPLPRRRHAGEQPRLGRPRRWRRRPPRRRARLRALDADVSVRHPRRRRRGRHRDGFGAAAPARRRRRRRHARQPAAGGRPGARRHRPGRRPGTARSGALRQPTASRGPPTSPTIP